MLGIKRTVIAQHERGLKWQNQRFAGVLEPGVHWIADPFGRIEIETYDLTEPAFAHKRADFVLKEARDICERYFQVVELGDREVGVVYRNGKVNAVLAPGTRQLYWLGPIEIRVDVHDLSTDFEVPDASVGLLVVDGEFKRRLQPGFYAFWKFNRGVKVDIVELRLRTQCAIGSMHTASSCVVSASRM
jgi:hypothetical protein